MAKSFSILKIAKRTGYLLLLLFTLLFIIPNVFNGRERQHFSGEERLKIAESLGDQDTLQISTSTFYERNGLVKLFLGSHYRNLWSLEVKYPVYKGYDSLEFKKIGGGMQTTSLEYEDESGRHYSFRSVDKDQSSVLPNWLQASGLRTLVRDQTSALNPFASKIIPRLAAAVDVPHLKPTYFIMPADDITTDSTLTLLAGQIATMTPELGGSWENDSLLNFPKYIWNTDELLKHVNNVRVDAQAYLKCRLFDMLISDWDRHEGQWKWLVYDQNQKLVAQPYPLDRDMAFCRFDDGIVNKLILATTNRFQSFRGDKEMTLSITQKINELDKMYLKELSESDFLTAARTMKQQLKVEVVQRAFDHYPPQVSQEIVKEHVQTLNSRIELLEVIAASFHENILKAKE